MSHTVTKTLPRMLLYPSPGGMSSRLNLDDGKTGDRVSDTQSVVCMSVLHWNMVLRAEDSLNDNVTYGLQGWRGSPGRLLAEGTEPWRRAMLESIAVRKLALRGVLPHAQIQLVRTNGTHTYTARTKG